MKKHDTVFLVGWGLLGLALWCREVKLSGLEMADALPLLAAFPLCWHFGHPWKAKASSSPLSMPLVLAALTGLAAGIIGEVGLLTAVGWTLGLGTWILSRFDTAPALLCRLLIIPLLGFPWLVGAGGLGWHFRLSAAWIAERVFAVMDFAVVREGTLLTVQGEPLSVEAACAGLGSLQAMLLAGTVAALMELGRRPVFWLALPLLMVAAWLANVLRVLLISAAALSGGREFASGLFHTAAGLGILFAVFYGCLFLFRSRWFQRLQKDAFVAT